MQTLDNKVHTGDRSGTDLCHGLKPNSMKAEFTKGTWVIVPLKDGSIAIKEKGLYEKGFSDRICELHDYDKEKQANAVLIANAPKMYAALYALTDYFNNFSQNERLGITKLLNDALDIINEITPPNE